MNIFSFAIVSLFALANSLMAGESNTAQGSYYSRVYNKEIRAYEDKDLYEVGGYRSPESYNVAKPYGQEQTQQNPQPNIPKPYGQNPNEQNPNRQDRSPSPCQSPCTQPSCANPSCQGNMSSNWGTRDSESSWELADNTPDQTYRPYDLARKSNTSDTELADAIRREIKRIDQTNKYSNVTVLVLNGIPSLSGTVNNENDHKDILEKVRSVRGVQNVKDQLKVTNR